MKSKTITISAPTTEAKIEIVCRLLSITAHPEIFVLNALYELNSGQATPLDSYNKKLLCLKGKVKLGTFDTSLNRLTKKGIITKAGSHYILHDIFKELHLSEALIIKW